MTPEENDKKRIDDEEVNNWLNNCLKSNKNGNDLRERTEAFLRRLNKNKQRQLLIFVLLDSSRVVWEAGHIGNFIRTIEKKSCGTQHCFFD
jgi:hypothetical protein